VRTWPPGSHLSTRLGRAVSELWLTSVEGCECGACNARSPPGVLTRTPGARSRSASNARGGRHGASRGIASSRWADRGRRGTLLGVLAVALATVLAGSAAGARPVLATGDAGTALNFQLVGHDSLSIAARTPPRRSSTTTSTWAAAPTAPTSTPAWRSSTSPTRPHPTTVGEIPIPATLSAGYTSRELRVWPQQQVLMVLYFAAARSSTPASRAPTPASSHCARSTSSTSAQATPRRR